MFMRDNLGLELYVSNQDLAQPSYEVNQVMLKEAHPSNSSDAAEKLRTMGEIAYNRELLDLTKTWIASHPAHFLRLVATRAFYFWMGPWEHPEMLAVSGLLTLLGFAGLFAMGKNGGLESTALIATVWIAYPVMYYLVQYVNRYRVSIDWTITLSAAAFVYQRLEAAAHSAPAVHEIPAAAH
jgi:hypothetical protein